MPKPTTAFVARSFADADVDKIRPLLDMLQTFEKLGFICQSAEPAEPELVSHKVQRLIRDCDVFIGFFTKKYPIYEESDGKFERSEPVKWTAPAWVLQESGCAVASGKKLMFFREVGVELPSLQGDLEYIEFDPKDLTEALRKLNEMVLAIVAKGLSIEVVTTVQQEKQNAPPEPKEEKTATEEAATTEGSGIVPFARRLFDALETHDADSARRAYDEGLEFVRSSDPDFELSWTLLYQENRFQAGYADAWDDLVKLRDEKKHWRIAAAMARCLSSTEETAQAAELYQAAAALASGPEKAWLLALAAGELDKLREFDRARRILIEASELANGANRTRILRRLYASLKEAGEVFEAFGVGEYSISQNSAQFDLHFTLGYDYSEASLNELSAFHYKTAVQQNPKDSAALNNLGVVYSALEMPISSVRNHVAAAELGNTLASGNLAFKYLDAGMLDDAEEAIAGATEESEHDVMVDDAQAEVKRRQELESAKNSDLLRTAGQQRGFFKTLGTAVLEGGHIDPKGTWVFPEFEIAVTTNGDEIEGSSTKEIRKSGLGGLFPEHGRRERIESYTLSGSLKGRICKFTLVVDTDVNGPGPVNTTNGYIVFSKDGNSGSVFENEPKIAQFEITRKPLSSKRLIAARIEEGG
jgi:hypothetical protein